MRHPPQDQIIPEQERASTGIPGLDHILGGGLPVNRRTTDHELTIREFRLGSSGVEVGQALTDFEGVLTGVASYKGALPLLSDSDASSS